MKLSTFFRILNRKINKYNEAISNPFEIPQPIVLIWIDEEENPVDSGGEPYPSKEM